MIVAHRTESTILVDPSPVDLDAPPDGRILWPAPKSNTQIRMSRASPAVRVSSRASVRDTTAIPWRSYLRAGDPVSRLPTTEPAVV